MTTDIQNGGPLDEGLQYRMDRIDESLRWNPDDELLWLDKGRIYAEARQYGMAIRTFSRGLARDPDCPLLYVERGHCAINIGRHDEAAADLGRANTLNPSHWNTLYHLGLAHYLLGEYRDALPIYQRTVDLAPGDSKLIPAVNWLWATLLHLGREEEAERALECVTDRMDPGGNGQYYTILLVAKGLRSPEEALAGGVKADVDSMTLAYGLSNYWYFVQKDAAQSENILRAIIEAGGTEGLTYPFAYRAAEAELARRGL